MTAEKIVISRNPTDFGSKLFLLQQNKKFCDATLLVNGERIDVHAHILVASSEFFENIFEKSTLKEVIFKDVDKDIIHSLIQYCYRGTLETTELKIEQMIQMARILSINSFIEGCKEILERRLNVDNCLSTWKLAQIENFDDLKRVAFEFIKENLGSISTTQNFLSLDYSDIKEVIGSGCLTYPYRNIYDAIKKWVNYDISSRTKNLADLLDHTHLAFFSIDFLISESLSMCKLNPLCQEKFLKAMELQKNRKLPLHENINTLIAVGDYVSLIAKTMELFDNFNKKWIKINDMNCNREEFATVLLDDKLLMIGGYKNENTVQSYDLRSGKMETLPSLSQGRCRTSVVNLEKNVYVIGGYDDKTSKTISSVEKWNSNSKSWSDVASLNTARYGCGAAVLGDQIFVVGGYGSAHLSSTESFNPTTNKWKSLLNMNEERKYPGVAAAGGYLYAVGGENVSGHLKTAERYDPKLNRWTYIQSLEVEKSWMAASNFMGKLVIAGGYTKDSTYTVVVEMYDEKEEKWKPMPSIKQNRKSFNLVEIPWTLAQCVISRKS